MRGNGIKLNKLSLTLACVSFLLSPLGSNIRFIGPISIGDVFVLYAFLQIFFVIKIKLIPRVGILSLCLVSLPSLFYYICEYPLGVGVWARMVFYIFLVFVFINIRAHDNTAQFLFRIYFSIVICCSVFIIFQVFTYRIFGVVFIAETPFDIEINALRVLDPDTQGFRTGGLFREPSYFAIYAAPALIFSALYKRKLMGLFLAASIVISTSALGFVMVMYAIMLAIPKRFFLLLPFFLGAMVLVPLDIILPERVYETITGAGSLEIRVVSPFLLLLNSENIFIPNISILNDLRDVDLSTGLWLNSFSYLVFVLGVLSLAPVAIIFSIVPWEVFPFLFILLLSTNSLSGPFFLVSFVVLSIVIYQYKKINAPILLSG